MLTVLLSAEFRRRMAELTVEDRFSELDKFPDDEGGSGSSVEDV